MRPERESLCVSRGCELLTSARGGEGAREAALSPPSSFTLSEQHLFPSSSALLTDLVTVT